MTSLRFFLFKLDSRKRFIKNHKSFFFTEPPGIEAKATPTVKGSTDAAESERRCRKRTRRTRRMKRKSCHSENYHSHIIVISFEIPIPLHSAETFKVYSPEIHAVSAKMYMAEDFSDE